MESRWQLNMASSVNVLSARRSYEFRQDDIRLTLVSNRGVIEHVREHFKFQFAEVRTPPDAFGPVPSTFPPGLVFALGITPYPENGATAIRSLSIEPMRVVIDAAGPSSVLDPTFDELRQLLHGIYASDGAPPIGEPIRTLDSSDLTVHLSFPPDALLPLPLRDTLVGAFHPVDSQKDTPEVVLPFLQVRLQSPEVEYLGSGSPSNRFLQLDLRSNTSPNDRIYYSSASLHTDAHIALLNQLDEKMSDESP